MDLHAFSRGDAIEVTCAQASPDEAALRRRYAVAVLLIASILVATTAALRAGRKNDLEIGLTARRVIHDGGEEKLIVEPKLAPGQVVQYTTAYRNRSEHTLPHLVPTLPIPRGSEYIPESAYPAPFEASIDGQTFEPYPIRHVRKLNNGLEEIVEVPAASYRALRWAAGDLAPSSTFTSSARVRVVATND